MAGEYLPWLMLAPVVAVWSFQLDGIFIGTTRAVAMRNAMILSLVVFLVAVWLLLPEWGNHGLWAALTVLMLIRCITLGIYFPTIVRDLPAS